MKMNIQEMSNVSKQILVLFRFMDKKSMEKIPRELIEHLKRLEIDANIKFKYEEDKSIEEQTLLEETKDLLAVIFYSYIADEKEKEEILKSWNDNEKKYNEIMLKDYIPEFERKVINNSNSQEHLAIVNENKGGLYKKIKNIIRRIFKK